MQIGITFEYPWALALFPVLTAFIIIAGKNMRLGSKIKKRAVRILRILLVLLITLAIAAPSVTMRVNQTATIFLADVSDSIRNQEKEMERFIHNAMQHATLRDSTGIIAFANEVSVVKMPQEEGGPSLQSRIQTDGTNIEKAMILASSIMPQNAARRIVLLTDGIETRGDAIETARILKRLGYTIDVKPFILEDTPEVQMDTFTAPRQVNARERFDVTVKITSNVNTKATIRLFGNRTLTAEKEVDLYSGENVFTFSDMVDQGGMVTYTAEVMAHDDTVLQNNQLSTFTQVTDRPRILMVEQGKAGENLFRYIEEYAQITRVHPLHVPTSLQGLLSYDAFILVDIAVEWLDEEFLKLLEQAVQHQGKGLLTIGGENSYAPGGYKGTPLETILPVNMDIRPKEENPDLGMILVIDKSGSMTAGNFGVTRLDLAKEAAIRAAEVMEETDHLGVIAFDDSIQWVIRTSPLSNRQAAIDLIGTIRPGGGTLIIPPLEEAWKNLKTIDTKLKHIILLTDGEAERYGYERIIDGLREDGITLSTVAVGEGADTLLLKALAYGGMGRYYEATEFTDIPSIFAKETYLAGQKFIENRRFYPELVTSMGLLKGIEAVPLLDGYVLTRTKPTARTVFESDAQDPVLAVWQYGLGRTAAWMSDIQGIWTSQWSLWQDAPVFWGNLTSWLVQKNLNTGYSVETQLRDGSGWVTLTAETESFTIEEYATGTLISPDGTKETFTLEAVRPGMYEGVIGKSDPGVYILHLQIPAGDEMESISTGLVMPYSQEYSVLQEHAEAFMQRLARAGGGRIVNDPEEVFKGEVQNIGGKRDLTRLLILLALILLLFDIALRKLQIPIENIALFWNGKVIPVMSTFLQGVKDRLPEKAEKEKSVKEHAIKDYTDANARNEKFRIQQQEPKTKKKEPSADTDHVNALLNRRKQWK